MSTSNRVGHPVRNRTRNRLIYNEDEETFFGPNNKIVYSTIPTLSTRQIKSSSTVSNRQIPEPPNLSASKVKANKNLVHTLNNNLKTLLKLPKSRNWVNYEWFYGNIDQVLFLDKNEFNVCLEDSFPQLKTRYLTRSEWVQIRRLMGKPRRCSPSFFEEERMTLNVKRNKIRHLQQNKVHEIKLYADLPSQIPRPLTVGSQVCALAKEGHYYGLVEGIDTANGSYRVNFQRDTPSITVPDYDVACVDEPTLVPLSSFQIKPRKVWHLSNKFVDGVNHATKPSNGFLPKEKMLQKTSKDSSMDHSLGGYPIRFLSLLVRASKTLNYKKSVLNEIKQLNSEIEHKSSQCEQISFFIRKQFALKILEIEEINQSLLTSLKKIQNYTLQQPSEGRLKSLKPDMVGQKYALESRNLLDQLQPTFKVNDKNYELILNLMSLMYHLRGFRDSEVSCYEFQSISETMANIRKMIALSKVDAFQNNVEIHIRHIMSSVSHLGNVGVFSEPVDNHASPENFSDEVHTSLASA